MDLLWPRASAKSSAPWQVTLLAPRSSVTRAQPSSMAWAMLLAPVSPTSLRPRTSERRELLEAAAAPIAWAPTGPMRLSRRCRCFRVRLAFRSSPTAAAPWSPISLPPRFSSLRVPCCSRARATASAPASDSSLQQRFSFNRPALFSRPPAMMEASSGLSELCLRSNTSSLLFLRRSTARVWRPDSEMLLTPALLKWPKVCTGKTTFPDHPRASLGRSACGPSLDGMLAPNVGTGRAYDCIAAGNEEPPLLEGAARLQA
mmetsp:Transcript_19870/g.59956  ORF Transcript_19870/g.59956 Transcript_19870/m.59956 type:complete len:259 (+) Transcript_19870:545-1321(+)